MDAPCKNCDERELGCHAHCIAYKKYSAERVVVRKKKLEDTRASGYVIEQMHRQQKAKRC